MKTNYLKIGLLTAEILCIPLMSAPQSIKDAKNKPLEICLRSSMNLLEGEDYIECKNSDSSTDGYMLLRDVTVSTGILTKGSFKIKNAKYVDGKAYAKKGFWWDGCSGPCIDRPENFVAALVHDILYRMRRLGCELFSRKRADKVWLKYCLLNDMNTFLAKFEYYMLRAFGGKNDDKMSDEDIEEYFANVA